MGKALLRNFTINFAVSLTGKAFQAAAANADWNSVPCFGVILSDQPGAASWPMTAATWILIPTHPKDRRRSAEEYFDETQ
jgi:phosphate transport system substrate-binding protein